MQGSSGVNHRLIYSEVLYDHHIGWKITLPELGMFIKIKSFYKYFGTILTRKILKFPLKWWLNHPSTLSITKVTAKNVPEKMPFYNTGKLIEAIFTYI